MPKLLRIVAPAAVTLLMVPPVVHAQTATVKPGGKLTVDFTAKFDAMLSNSGASVSFLGAGPASHGEHFSISGGPVNLQTGYGTVTSLGAATFTEGGNTLALDQFQVSEDASGFTVTAEVFANNADQGRLPVFALQDELFQPPLAEGRYKSGPVSFTLSPSFLSIFEQYIPVSGLKPDEALGSFHVDATLSRK